MADVFISYKMSSPADRAAAAAVCSSLEAAGIICWIAEREAPKSRPGETWAAAIVGAIQGSGAMVLVLSSASNASPDVHNEVTHAGEKPIPIIVYRIENVQPCPHIDYYVRKFQWVDAFGRETGESVAELVGRVLVYLVSLDQLTSADTYPRAFAAALALTRLDSDSARQRLRKMVESEPLECRVAACAWLLAEWGAEDAAGAMRTAIESRRRTPGPLSCLLRSLHTVENHASSAYVAEVLLAARDYQQEGVLSMLGNHAGEFRGEPEILAAVKKLACEPTSPSVMRRAKQLMSALQQ